MLVGPGRLNAALNNYDLRNQLIAELHDTSTNDSLRNYKFILAVWLGSNVTIEKMRSEMLFAANKEYIFPGCFCAIALDKAISLNPAEELVRCREYIFDLLNFHYKLIETNGNKLYQIMLRIVENVSSRHSKVKKICIAEIKRAFEIYNPLANQLPLEATKKVSNDKLTNPSVIINKIITGAWRRYPFHNYPFFFGAKKCDARKVFVTASDGVVIDATSVSKQVEYDDVVVLALIGHYAAEHICITRDSEDYAEFFGALVVFLNHRNYTLRSSKFAQSIDELADDIVCFAKFYHAQNKRIVLYGMCGGGAHMIEAAIKLQHLGIPFKIIIDRSASAYINFFDIKTTLLAHQYKEDNDYTIGLLGLLGNPFIRLFLLASHTNINFSKRLAMVDENDVLTLQGKDNKNSKHIDAYIHNDNATRTHFKDRRHAHRVVLKKLIELSLSINSFYAKNIEEVSEWQRLSELFILMLNLIDNEKITIASLDNNDPQDIHTLALFNLITTKNTLPIKNFVRGFFIKPCELDKDFSAFLAYSNHIIHMTVTELYSKLNPEQTKKLSDLLETLLIEIRANHSYLTHMAQRVATSTNQVLSVINQIVTGELFNQLHANNLQPKVRGVI